MIAFLKGTIFAKGSASVIIEVSGVGYTVSMSTSALAQMPQVGERVLVHTYLQMRDDGMSMFGFSTEQEKLMFEKLITVSGVGPKVALSALSSFSSEALSAVIADGDATRVATIPGIGKKTAQRIILELKGVIESEPTLMSARAEEEKVLVASASEALLAMGFTSSEVDVALRDFDGDLRDVSAVVRYGLKRLGSSL